MNIQQQCLAAALSAASGMRTHLAAIAAVLCAGTLLTACSSDDETETDTGCHRNAATDTRMHNLTHTETMKIHHILSVAALVCAALLTACSQADDMDAPCALSKTPGRIVTLTATATVGHDTRAALASTDANGTTPIEWESGDRLFVYFYNTSNAMVGEAVTLPIDNTALAASTDKTLATFTARVFVPQAATKMVAVYRGDNPAVPSLDVDLTAQSVTGQDGQDGALSYKKGIVMSSAATAYDDGQSAAIAFTLTARTSVLELHNPVPEGVTETAHLTSVKVLGAYTHGTLNPLNGSWRSTAATDIALQGVSVVQEDGSAVLSGRVAVIPGASSDALFVDVTNNNALPAPASTAVTTDAKWATVDMPATTATLSYTSSGVSTTTQVQFTAFRLGKHEVTNAQYAAFLNAFGIKGITGTCSTDGNDNASATVAKAKLDATLAIGGKYSSHHRTAAYTRSTAIPGGRLVTLSKPFDEEHVLARASAGTNQDWGLSWDETRQQWMPVAGKENFPVVYISWFGAKAFSRWLGGDLPSEAQWERAARTVDPNGTLTNEETQRVAWVFANSGDVDGNHQSTHEVGTRWATKDSETADNVPLDILGNAEEWTNDWYNPMGSYPSSHGDDPAHTTTLDPNGPATQFFAGPLRVCRGGDYYRREYYSTSVYRESSEPDYGTTKSTGFRVLLPAN